MVLSRVSNNKAKKNAPKKSIRGGRRSRAHRGMRWTFGHSLRRSRAAGSRLIACCEKCRSIPRIMQTRRALNLQAPYEDALAGEPRPPAGVVPLDGSRHVSGESETRRRTIETSRNGRVAPTVVRPSHDPSSRRRLPTPRHLRPLKIPRAPAGVGQVSHSFTVSSLSKCYSKRRMWNARNA